MLIRDSVACPVSPMNPPSQPMMGLKRSMSIKDKHRGFKNFLGNTSVEVTKYIKMRMTIEDNGVGIAEQNLNKLFTDYSCLKEHSKLNAKGTGLGLSICKNIIEQMGGSVEVESTLGVGTKFHITNQMKVIDKPV